VIFFRHRPESIPADDPMDWADMLHLSQLNTLSLAHLLLAVMDDPEIVTDDTREQVVEMIQELQDGVARFEEWCI